MGTGPLADTVEREALSVFQPAVPVAKVLQGIHSSEYVLPAIQREFVWETDQITRLFDSLMRGYPSRTSGSRLATC